MKINAQLVNLSVCWYSATGRKYADNYHMKANVSKFKSSITSVGQLIRKYRLFNCYFGAMLD